MQIMIFFYSFPKQIITNIRTPLTYKDISIFCTTVKYIHTFTFPEQTFRQIIVHHGLFIILLLGSKGISVWAIQSVLYQE